jgi:hypothetical protein
VLKEMSGTGVYFNDTEHRYAFNKD